MALLGALSLVSQRYNSAACSAQQGMSIYFIMNMVPAAHYVSALFLVVKDS